MFLRNITIFLENIKVFFAAWECVKTKPRPYEPKEGQRKYLVGKF